MSSADFEQQTARDAELMTVGELSRRTGLSIKAIRELATGATRSAAGAAAPRDLGE